MSLKRPASVLQTQEVDFPRGGGTSLTQVEVKQLRLEGRKEADAALTRPTKKRKYTNKNDALLLEGEKKKEAPNPKIAQLSYARLSPNSRLLVLVTRIERTRLLVSLPGREMRGFVPLDSEQEGAWFKVGQVWPATVKDVLSGEKERDRVHVEIGDGEMSKADLATGQIVVARVKSVEDKGYVLSLPAPEVTSFLPFSSLSSDSTLVADQPILVTITSPPTRNSRTVPTTLIHKFMTQPPTIRSIVPLSQVNATITDVTPHGVKVKFGKDPIWKGTVEAIHLQHSTENYKEGKKIQLRVLYPIPEPEETTWALSELQGVMKLMADRMDGQEVGSMVQAEVERVEKEWGVWVSFDNGERGWIHISHLSDERLTNIERDGPFALHSQHKARILSFSPLEGYHSLTLRPSLLAMPHFSLSSVQPGQKLKCTVKRVTPGALFVDYGGKTDGVIFPNHWADVKVKEKDMEKKWGVGKTVKARVWSVTQGTERVVLTLRKSLVDSEEGLEGLDRGTMRKALVVKAVEDRGMLVESWGATKMWISAKDMPKPPSTYAPESVVTSYILTSDPVTHKITASLLPPPPEPPAPGTSLTGRLTATQPPNAIFSLPAVPGYTGLCSLAAIGPIVTGTEVEGLIVSVVNEQKRLIVLRPSKHSGGHTRKDVIEPGAKVQVKVLGSFAGGWRMQINGARMMKAWMHWCEVDDYDLLNDGLEGEATVIKVEAGGRVELSMRTAVNGEKDERIESVAKLKEGEWRRGFVKGVGRGGVFVALGKSVDARVQIKELADEFIKEWMDKFHIGQLVRGKILKIDSDSKRVEMTFRTRPAAKKKSEKSISDYQVGEKVRGTVKRKEPYGLFIKIDGSRLSGLCHKSQVPGEDLDAFDEGDEVRASITSVDVEKGRLAFSLLEAEESTEEEEKEEAENEESTAMQVDVAETGRDEEVVAPLKAGGFNWGADESDGDQDDAEMAPLAQENEEHLDTAVTAESFESEIAATPHLAAPWIKMISFHVQLHQLVQARQVCHRALAAIPFREEEEKLKIWLAWLNVENSYGTGETWDVCLGQAEEKNEAKHLWLGVVKILERSGKLNREEEIWKKLFAKYKTSSKVWTLYGQHLLNLATPDSKVEFQSTLPKSLKSLPKHKHVKTIVAFGRMEFLSGASERGRTIFEGVLDSFPKRLDVWKVYLDLEKKVGNFDATRNLFERVTKAKWSSKKSKFLFKSWLEFEKEHGNERTVEQVKQKAVDYVQNVL
ncbi:hypothetical protein BT69DRAFT_1271010 [Atractiella rhizophila]|nr:hypothetical protein BT69DRAFT_1271010 [Atractiella rhizophila]